MPGTDLLAHTRDLIFDDVARGPARLAAADLAHEALEDRGSLPGMRHFGMELHAIEAAVLIDHGRQRSVRRAGSGAEAWRQCFDAIAMTHPDIEQAAAVADMIGQPFQQSARRTDRDF